MRRLAILICLTLTATVPASAAGVDFNIFAAVDTGGSLGPSALSLDADRGFSAGVEVVLDMPVIDVGAGAEYGLPRNLEGHDTDFSYTLLYAIARVSVLGPIYAVGRYGYSDPKLSHHAGDLDLGGSGSWSAGAGVSLADRVMVEVLYTSIGGDADYNATLARVLVSF